MQQIDYSRCLHCVSCLTIKKTKYGSELVSINISKIDNLIDGYNNLINVCRDVNSIDNNNIRKTTPYGVNHPVYSPAVAAIVSFINMGKYYLSSELLVHAKENSDRNGTYAPYFQSQVYETSEYIRLKESLRNNSVSGSGSSTFKKGSTTKDIDLYYAIHKYNYYTSQLTITDYYDFDYEKSGIYDGLSGTAINIMYAAQLLGVIVPYNVQLSLIR